ncbi:hypothetical protein [Streptomyces sp. NPDC101455]|uniref:hypothetical protein n=1 Tax=Streptomyces sp. NPDC101455 TaxID=3366142 RepID=UPI003805927D
MIIFDTTWTQNAAAFRNEPAQLVFESVNEPQFDNTDNARAAELPNEPNTSFHTVVRARREAPTPSARSCCPPRSAPPTSD